MNPFLTSLLCLGVLASLILLCVIVRRTSKSSNDLLEAVRNELRLGREEGRTNSRELREEVSTRIQSMDEALRQTLAAYGQLQQNHYTGVATQLREMAEAHRTSSESMRSTLDSRIKDLQDGNDRKLAEIRTEIATGLKASTESVTATLGQMSEAQRTLLGEMNKQVKGLTDSNQETLERIRTTVDGRIRELQDSNDKKLGDIRLEMGAGLKANSEALVGALQQMNTAQQGKFDGMTLHLKELAGTNQESLDRIRITLDSRVKELQDSNEKKLDALRTEVSTSLKEGSEAQTKILQTVADAQNAKLEGMTGQMKEMAETNRTALDAMRTAFDSRVKELQDSNEKKLEEMRRTVDEKLHDTLEKRLGESFKLVSDRLESVHKGLGEMQSLASGVGDLKRVLTNVKSRGTWAEVQLGAILDQMLTAEQFAKNVCVKEGSAERVEFAIRLPGSKEDPARCMWLPIDSKFPNEDYARLQTAADVGDSAAVQVASDALLRTLRQSARDIHEKYVNPPETTDFAIMFLATEGLYAEALRQPAFVEELQHKYRVVIAGPTTLSAVLSSLRMGFQTLVVEKRAAEVWRVLGAVKTEFGKFGGVLDKVQRQLQTASRTIEQTGTRTKAMERKLRSVEQLSPTETATILKLPGMGGIAISEGGEANETFDSLDELPLAESGTAEDAS
jgi:DNA recombination protein RmuC